MLDFALTCISLYMHSQGDVRSVFTVMEPATFEQDEEGIKAIIENPSSTVGLKFNCLSSCRKSEHEHYVQEHK